MRTVSRFNWEKNRGKFLNTIIIHACDIVQEKGISLEEQPEKIAEFADELDRALQEKFPELRRPE
ncbi:hypothetical protein GF312_16215 [Candidatus Poribacteria bacterium]|nr:hypothetical protein [Candidatus Poribacteria bacterium]